MSFSRTQQRDDEPCMCVKYEGVICAKKYLILKQEHKYVLSMTITRFLCLCLLMIQVFTR